MAIIGKVERKNWKVILLSVVIHLILLLGAATMVYPLLLMLSGSVKSAVDFKDFTLFPDYLLTEKDGQKLLFKKVSGNKIHQSGPAHGKRFQGSGDHIRYRYTPGPEKSSPAHLGLPEFSCGMQTGTALHWEKFCRNTTCGIRYLLLPNCHII